MLTETCFHCHMQLSGRGWDSRVWMISSRVWMRSSRVWMRSSRVWMRSSRVLMRSSRVWMRSSSGWDLAEWLERLAVKVNVATVLGPIPASSDRVESEGRQMMQRWIMPHKKKKIPLKKAFSAHFQGQKFHFMGLWIWLLKEILELQHQLMSHKQANSAILS
jgi:hypothetical protein